MTQEILDEILERHERWLCGEPGGERADLRGANLCGANLRDAKLSGAKLSGANLRGANLRNADLCDADLRNADLCDADLRGANLRGANLCDAKLRDAKLSGAKLSGANLRGADLCGAYLRDADLRGADLRDADLCDANLCGANTEGVLYNEKTAFFALQCPEEGTFVAWKKAEGKIIKLLIPEDSKRSSATSRKCRCSKAKVLEIQCPDGMPCSISQVTSSYDHTFLYRVGETAEVPDFDEDRWNECSTGIHFFITRDEAVNYG